MAGGALRDKWVPVGRIDVREPESDHEQNDGDLDEDDDVIEARRLLDPDHEQEGDQGDQDDSREVEHAAGNAMDRARLRIPYERGLAERQRAVECRSRA